MAVFRACFLVVLGACAVSGTALTWGHAAYAYGPMKCSDNPCATEHSCNKAQYVDAISTFNKAAQHEDAVISQVLSYGGDVEFWATAGSDDPTACWAPASDECNPDVYFDADNEAAAVKYLGSHGVDHVHALVDGRMDGWQMISTYDNYDACGYGDFYPNLSNLTDAELVTLGGKLASLYCRSDVISGVQVDLEPFTEPYEASLTLFIAATSAAMRSEEGNAGNGCVSDAHPDGRAVSYFTFAHSQSHDFGTSALGANGFFVFSMYDLDPKPADGGMMYNTVAEFKEKLRYELNYIPAVVGSNVHFTMAVPISASCHEYEQYVPGPQPGCGPACTPETNTAKMHEYVQGMFDVLLSDDVRSAFGNLFCMNSTAQSQFLGLSFWVYTPECSYPPMRWFSNNFLPTTPTASVDAVLHEHLHKLSSSALCAPPDTCDKPDGRANGCTCGHSYECASDWCTGTCTNPPSSWLDDAPASWRRQYGEPRHHAGAKAALHRKL